MNDKTQVTERDTSAVAQRTGERSSKTPAVVPAVDVVEDKHGITLWADLPGVTREKLDLRVEGPNLFIEAEATVPMPAELRVHHTELQQPRFARVHAERRLRHRADRRQPEGRRAQADDSAQGRSASAAHRRERRLKPAALVRRGRLVA